jgi:hypothetical protein
MASYTASHLFEKTSRKLIENLIEELSDNLSLGLLTSFEEYKHITGKIAGLRTSLDLLDDAESEVSKILNA